MMPLAMHSSSTSREAGMATSRTYRGIFLPRRIRAAAAKSSTRPPVQVPMRPWSTFTPSRSAMGLTLSTLWGAATWGVRPEMSKTWLSAYR